MTSGGYSTRFLKITISPPTDPLHPHPHHSQTPNPHPQAKLTVSHVMVFLLLASGKFCILVIGHQAADAGASSPVTLLSLCCTPCIVRGSGSITSTPAPAPAMIPSFLRILESVSPPMLFVGKFPGTGDFPESVLVFYMPSCTGEYPFCTIWVVAKFQVVWKRSQFQDSGRFFFSRLGVFV